MLRISWPWHRSRTPRARTAAPQVELLESRLVPSAAGAARPVMPVAPAAPPAALSRASAVADSARAAGAFILLQGDVKTVPTSPPKVISANPLVMVQSRSLTAHLDRIGDVKGTVTVTCNFTTGTYTTSFTLQTSQGDTITGTGRGWLSPTATPGVLAYTEINTISGGTGRFAGAAGALVCRGQLNTTTGAEAGSLAGVILLASGRGH